jgi:short-subunit dehydrogenase
MNRGLAVVTGAAGGLGAAFARQLAERGYRLLLVDRRQAQLADVCQSITAQHRVSAEPYALDLCNREEVLRLGQRLAQEPDLTLLVNNAGFGSVDYFADTELSYLMGEVDVHIAAPTILTRSVLPGMLARNNGGIINVSSIGAFIPSAGNAQYGSTKSYLAMVSMCLAEELRGTNVHVHALCPGFVRTEFHEAESNKVFKQQCAPPAHMWLLPDFVVSYALRKLGGRRVLIVPGLKYRIMARFAQMPLLRRLMQWISRVPRNLKAAAAPAVASCPQPAMSEAKRA